MKIYVKYYPTCTWVFEDDSFYCTHDEVEVVEYVTDHMGFNGHYQVEGLEYVCAECGAPVEGSPYEDREEALAEY